MTPTEVVVDRLLPLIASWTGFRSDAIHRASVVRGVERLRNRGIPVADVPLLAMGQGFVRDTLEEAVSVGETYFFRETDHFVIASTEVVPGLLAMGKRKIRAWSAGCSSGPEAFSLAACLRASVPDDVEIEVLGTDLVQRNVAEAEGGVYRAATVRESGPVLFTGLDRLPDDRLRVQDPLRAVTRFARHNLLDEPDFGEFDVVFCRNVLVYLTVEAARTVVSHIERCLAPGGVVFFGAVDLTARPDTLVQYGRCGQVFMRPACPGRPPPARDFGVTPLPAVRRHDSPCGTPARGLPLEKADPGAPDPSTRTATIARHLAALEHLERGELSLAAKALTDLLATAENYLPGLLERALLHNRCGERQRAVERMREVLRRAARLPSRDVVAGPEPLPVDFYRRSAEAFLERYGEHA